VAQIINRLLYEVNEFRNEKHNYEDVAQRAAALRLDSKETAFLIAKDALSKLPFQNNLVFGSDAVSVAQDNPWAYSKLLESQFEWNRPFIYCIPNKNGDFLCIHYVYTSKYGSSHRFVEVSMTESGILKAMLWYGINAQTSEVEYPGRLESSVDPDIVARIDFIAGLFIMLQLNKENTTVEFTKKQYPRIADRPVRKLEVKKQSIVLLKAQKRYRPSVKRPVKKHWNLDDKVLVPRIVASHYRYYADKNNPSQKRCKLIKGFVCHKWMTNVNRMTNVKTNENKQKSA